MCVCVWGGGGGSLANYWLRILANMYTGGRVDPATSQLQDNELSTTIFFLVSHSTVLVIVECLLDSQLHCPCECAYHACRFYTQLLNY